MKYCLNCETEATHWYEGSGVVYYLCTQCKEAFELGQARADVGVFVIEEENEDDELPVILFSSMDSDE